MKYAVGVVLHNAFGYWDGLGWTTVHNKARLYLSRDEARTVMVRYQGEFIEDIRDEVEFNSRP